MRKKKKVARRKPTPRKKRVAKKKTSRKKVAAKKKRAVRRAAPRKATSRKKLAARKKPAPQAFPQRAEASAKQLVLFELMRARATFLSAIQGLVAASDPIAPGKWSPREIVLHVVTRDLARLRELETTLRGVPASWKDLQEGDWARVNEENLAPLRHHDWDEALRLLNRTRQQLIEELESVPEEPSEPWSPEHAFGAMLAGLPPHDRHHAEQIKRWRASRGA